LSPDDSGQRPSVSLRPAVILADGSAAAQATRRSKRSLCEAPRRLRSPGPPRPRDRAPPRGPQRGGGSEARRRGGSRSEPDPVPGERGGRRFTPGAFHEFIPAPREGAAAGQDSAYERPTIRPSSSRSMRLAAGVGGSPGMVMMLPARG